LGKNIQNNFFINPESIDLTCNDLSEIQQNINHIAKVLKILENIEKKKNTPLLTWSTLDINQTVRELLLEYFESEFLQEIHLELTTQVNVLKKEKQQPCIPDWDTKYGLDHAGEHLLLLISIIKAKFGLN